MKILVFNAGSSSLRFTLFETRANSLKSLYKGHFDNHGKEIKDFEKAVVNATRELIIKKALKNLGEAAAIGHRVVHGGNIYKTTAKITSKVIKDLQAVSFLAPLHNPPNIAVILACKKLFPAVLQVAVFDTSFFKMLPEKAYLYGLPRSLAKKLSIRRYGFHGTSHQYVFEQARKRLGEKATKKTITCHLGNGCSITAIKDGKAIDTSMGFTPLEGVPMGTRSGNIDPSIVFYLMKNGFSPAQAENLLYYKSGLLGVSEISADIRTIWAKYKKGDGRARRAFEWFAYQIAKYIGSYAAALGGLDCLVFTGGIGENASYLRKWICAYLKPFLRFKVLVIQTDEERKIAEEALRLI